MNRPAYLTRVMLIAATSAASLGVTRSAALFRRNGSPRHLQSVDSNLAPTLGDDQGIRGGFGVEALPWFVVFDDFLCGGALIHPDIVLTSAACVETSVPTAVRVGAGTTLDGTVVGVLGARVYPDWDGNFLNGADIALLKLDRTLTNDVAAFNTDASVPVVTSDIMFLMGFGILDDTGTEPNILQGLFLNYVEDCFSRFPDYRPDFHVCGDATPEYGSCAGDGGGPVVLSGTNNVVGIVSFSDGSCETQTIDVFTRVATYSGWIEDRICDLSVIKPDYCGPEHNKFDKYDCFFIPSLFNWLI